MEHDDIDAVVGSHRPKIAFLFFLIVVGIAAAVIHRMIPRGTGNDEAADRILIVQEYSGGLAAYLSQYGFEAVTGSHNAWKNKIPEEMPEMAGKDIQLAEILAFADRYGYGFVAIENPERFDYADLDIEPAPSFDEHTRFAVLTTGDFAFPHVFSKNPKPSEVMGSRGLDLMRALFEQPQLAETLDPANSSMDGIKLRSVLAPAIDEVTQLGELEKQVENIMLKTHDELEGKSAVGNAQIRLADKVSEGSSIIALADGRAMTVSQEVSLTSDNGIRLDLEVSRDWHLRSLMADAPLAAEERKECAEILGGTIDRSERLASEGSVDGKTVLIRTVGGGTQLFAFKADAGICGLEPIGAVELPESFSGRVAVGGRAVAAKSRESGQSIVDVVDVDGKSTRLGDFSNRGSKSLTWLDARHLALVSYTDEGEAALVLLSLDHPELVLELPMTERSDLHELRVLEDGAKASLVLRSSARGTNRIERLDFNHSWAELFSVSLEKAAEQKAQGGTDEADYGATVVHLDPIEELLLTTVVEVDSGMKPFDLSPDGKWAAYTSFAEGGKEVHLVRVPTRGGSPSAPLTLTSDEFYDRDVVFSRDGKRLFWRTEHELGSVNGTLYSVRGVDLAPIIER